MIIIIAAKSKNNVIGKDNDLPWHIPEDLKRFKELTKGHPVIMGRKTYESIVARIGKPLPGRPHFVLSRSDYAIDPEFANQVTVCKSIGAAVQRAEAMNSEVYVIGGERLFEAALPDAQKMELTEIDAEYEGDAYFPKFDANEWNRIVEPHSGYVFATYIKK